MAQRRSRFVRELFPVQHLDCHLIALPLAVVHGAKAALAQLPTDGDCVPCNVEPAQLTVLQQLQLSAKALAAAWAYGAGGEGGIMMGAGSQAPLYKSWERNASHTSICHLSCMQHCLHKGHYNSCDCGKCRTHSA
jgi:hypothetical protein